MAYLVQTDGLYFIVEDKPDMKSDTGWELSGDQVQIQYHIAYFLAKIFRNPVDKNGFPLEILTNGTVIDIDDTGILF